jgi:hypothetical protein
MCILISFGIDKTETPKSTRVSKSRAIYKNPHLNNPDLNNPDLKKPGLKIPGLFRALFVHFSVLHNEKKLHEEKPRPKNSRPEKPTPKNSRPKNPRALFENPY